jgi:hypothetical protein
VPFAPIPLKTISIGVQHIAGDQVLPAPLAFASVAGVWPVQAIIPPQPIEHYLLTSFYLPVSLWVKGATTNPTICQLTTQLLVSGELAFQNQDQFNLNSVLTTASANSSANVTVNSPVVYRSGQALQLGFRAMFDQTIASGWVGLAAIGDGQGGFVPTPGSIGYSIEAEHLILVP